MVGAMLLAFRTANFRSLRDEVELSLVVPAWVPDEDRVVRPVGTGGGDRVGTVAGIYGANASGKSNVLMAMRAMCEAVRDSHQRWQPTGGAPHDPFLLDDDHRSRPTLFEADLLLDRGRWQYGFRMDGEGVVAEWLYAFPHGRKRVWFERDRSGEFYVGKSLTGQVSTMRELTRPNSLFLSVGAANNHPDLTKVAERFSDVTFADRLIHDVSIRLTAGFLDDRVLGTRIQQLLRFADLGIVKAQPLWRAMDDDLRARVREAIRVASPDRSETSVDEAVERLQHDVMFEHRAGDHTAMLRLEQESVGTQTWFALLAPLSSAMTHGLTFVVDELDASLHPQLTARLIEMFHDPNVNTTAAQLVFSTHDTSLLGSLAGNQPLRRDELWLTEKDESGATRLFPATDFHPRKHENLERGYLQGRYGAVPVLRSLPASEPRPV